MSLEKLFTKEGKVQSYKTDVFYDAFTAAQALPNVDITTTEGLESLTKLTGYDVSGFHPAEAEVYADTLKNTYPRAAQEYGMAHFTGLVKELEPELQEDFALNFVPQNSYKPEDLKEDEVDAYDEAREKLLALQQKRVLLQDKKNHGTFLEMKRKEMSQTITGQYIMNYILAHDKGHYIEVMKYVIADTAHQTFAKYGGGLQFMMDTRERMKPVFEKASRAAAALEADKQKAVKELEGKSFGTQAERAAAYSTITKAYEEKEKQLSEKHPDAGIIPGMNQEVIPFAYQAITRKKERAAAEAAAKKAEAEAHTTDKKSGKKSSKKQSHSAAA